MKYYLFCGLFFLLLGSCGDHHSDTDKTGDTTGSGSATRTDSKAGTDDQTSTGAGADTLLWVGKPARYKKSPDFILDGKYDSASQVFIACNDTKPEKVPDFSMIAYDDVSNCDTSFGSSVRYITLSHKTQIPGLTNLRVVQQPGEVLANQPVQVKGGDQLMAVSPADMERIRKAAVVHVNLINQHKIIKALPPGK